MDEQLRKLKDKISQMSDEDLLQIVEVDYDDYRKEAIEFARAELEQRNVAYEEPGLDKPDEGVEAEGEEPDFMVPPADVLPCDACGGEVRSGSIFADKEISIFFPDKNEERFIQALACSNCGSMRLVVDFNTDVEG